MISLLKHPPTTVHHSARYQVCMVGLLGMNISVYIQAAKGNMETGIGH